MGAVLGWMPFSETCLRWRCHLIWKLAFQELWGGAEFKLRAGEVLKWMVTLEESRLSSIVKGVPRLSDRNHAGVLHACCDSFFSGLTPCKMTRYFNGSPTKPSPIAKGGLSHVTPIPNTHTPRLGVHKPPIRALGGHFPPTALAFRGE